MFGYDHQVDVLGYAQQAEERGEAVALVVVTGTTGGTVRPRGAFMVVTEEGNSAGFISAGCVDGDVIRQAVEALREGKARRLLYGQGSPYFDIILPCGGSIELLVLPINDPGVLRDMARLLSQRQSVGLRLVRGEALKIEGEELGEARWEGEDYCLTLSPKLRLRIAGRGVETLALVRIVLASGFEAIVQSPDGDFLEEAKALGALETDPLLTPSTVPDRRDDPWTAFILMFHDHDWELELLKAALKGEAFYIGALGSKRTQARRLEALSLEGVAPEQLQRIHGPIGLVPAQRDAARLALSALAEIIGAFEERPTN